MRAVRLGTAPADVYYYCAALSRHLVSSLAHPIPHSRYASTCPRLCTQGFANPSANPSSLLWLTVALHSSQASLHTPTPHCHRAHPRPLPCSTRGVAPGTPVSNPSAAGSQSCHFYPTVFPWIPPWPWLTGTTMCPVKGRMVGRRSRPTLNRQRGLQQITCVKSHQHHICNRPQTKSSFLEDYTLVRFRDGQGQWALTSQHSSRPWAGGGSSSYCFLIWVLVIHVCLAGKSSLSCTVSVHISGCLLCFSNIYRKKEKGNDHLWSFYILHHL